MAAHSWWRLNFLDNGTAGGLHIHELIFRGVLNGPQLAVGGTPSTNSVYLGDVATYGPQQAFDNNVATLWANATGVLAWLAYHFLSPVSIVEISINSDSTQSPLSFQLQYSDDGVGWTTYYAWASQGGSSGTGFDGYWDFPLYEFTPHGITANSAPPITVSASSENAGSGCQAFKALDMDNAGGNKFWLTNSIPAPGWWAIDLGAGNTQALTAYKVRVNSAAAPSQTSAPKNWTMEASNNGSTWTVVDTQINQTAWQASEIRAYTLSSAAPASRYYRINVSATNGDPTFVQIGEMYLIAAPAPAAPGSVPATPISLTSSSLMALPDPRCTMRADVNRNSAAKLPCYWE